MARRVNTRFLIVLTVIVLGLAVAVFVAQKVFLRDDPQEFVDAARELTEEKKYEAAEKNMRQAVALDQGRADLWLMYGDAASRLAGKDFEFAKIANGAWNKALEIEPANKEALSRLMRLHMAELQQQGTPDFSQVISPGLSVARKYAQVDPSNPTAAAGVHIFTIAGLTAGAQTDPQKVEEAIATLQKLSEKDPANADLPFYVADAQIFQGRQLAGLGRPSDAAQKYAEAEKTMETALERQPENPAMHYRASEIWAKLLAADSTKENREKHEKRIKQAIVDARKHVKPDHPLFGEIYISASLHAQHNRDVAAAEKLLREVLEKDPTDQKARLQLARLLSHMPDRRDEAVELLEMPVASQDISFERALETRSLEINTFLALADLRLDRAAAADDAEKKQQELAKFEDAYSKIIAHTGDDRPFALRLKGKQQRLMGKHIEAIQTLNRAMTLMDQAGQNDPTYYDTINMLALSYTETRQTGAAKTLLNKLVQRYPNEARAHMLLAQLLLQEKSPEAARTHIESLEKLIPQHPEVIKLRMRLLDPAKDAEAMREAYAKLPEGTRREILDKANTAQVIGQSDEAVRLLTGLSAKDPADLDASVMLARVYLSRDEKNQAIKTVGEALKLHPENQSLRVLLGRLNDESPEALREVRREMIAKIDDPFVRAIQLADMARDENDADEWFKQLKEAERLKPTDPRVYERLFTYYVSKREFEKAQPVLEAMARANQDQAGGLLFRFRLASAKGEHQEAMSYASQLTQKMPEFATSWLSLGQAYQALGQHEEAVQGFVKALEKQNENIDAIRGLIESYIAMNRPADARRYIDQGAKRYPDSPLFREMQLAYELQFGDPAKVLPARQEAVAKNPGAIESWLKLAQVQLVVAQNQRSKNDAAGAEASFAEARKTLTQAIEKFPEEMRLYRMLSTVEVDTKHFDEAVAVLKQLAAREAWKERPEPQLMIAEVQARAGHADDATATLRGLAERFPENVTVQLGLASILAQTGKPDEALAALTADDPNIVRERLKLLVQAGRLDEADKGVEAALAKNPTAVDLLAFAALVDMNRNRWDEAVRRLQQALELEPKNQTAQYHMAMLRLRQPQPDTEAAIRILTAVRDQNPENIDARFLLAEAYQRRNDVDNASRELEAALQRMPANKNIRLTLAQVYAGAGRWNDTERVLRAGRELPQLANDLDLIRTEMEMWVARKDHAKALERLKQAMAVAPNHPQLIRDHAAILLDARDYKGVIAVTDPVISADKNAIWALQTRAIAKRRLNDKDGALADFEAALVAANAQRSGDAATTVVRTMAEEIGVDEALDRIAERAKTENRWRLMSAFLLQSKGDFDGAAEMVEAALAEYDKLTPDEKVTALRFAGSLYLGMKPQPQVQKAYDAYSKLLQLQPNDLYSLNNMACLLAESMNPPRPKEAIEYSTRAFDLMMDAGLREPLIMDTQGWMLTLNGQVDRGIDVLRQTVATRSFPDAHYHLAEAYLKKQYPEEAQKQLELASQHVNAAREKKQPVDAALEARIQDATARAKEMIRAKSEAKAR